MKSVNRSFWFCCLLAFAATLLSACTPIVRERTLPPSIRSVYIPMIENRTQQPGLEERMTVAVQKELLADGRLSLVREKEADAVLRLIVTHFDEVPQSFDGDDFATNKTYDVEAMMEIRENIPGRPIIGGQRDVLVSLSYGDDQRSTGFRPESYHLQRLSDVFARAVILELLTGQFEVEATNEEDETPIGEETSISIGTTN